MNPGLGLSRQFASMESDISVWRRFYGEKLQHARKVFSPSQSTANIVMQYFDLENISVQLHPEKCIKIIPNLPPQNQPYRIAIIGAIGQHKGYSILLKCAKSALKNGLPLEFIVFGYTQDDESLSILDNVKLVGAYTQEGLPEKLANFGCHIAVFLSVWPETFSYTLSEAWRSGLYPVAFDIGALAERIREIGYGSLIPLTQDAKQINTALIEIVERIHLLGNSEFSTGRDYLSILKDYYGFDAACAA